MDPDQTRSSLIWVHTACLYAKIGLKSLQEYSADDINRRHFQMQVFLALKGLNKWFCLATVKCGPSNGGESYEKYRNPALFERKSGVTTGYTALRLDAVRMS